MKYYVYVLKSENKNYFYKGLTEDVSRRLSEHNSGKNKTTRPYKPFVLLFFEEFKTREEARKREKWFKTGEGREFIKAKILMPRC